ncbi:Dhr2p [Sugiyamaella lignohabitans]|uniref:RNA helicase n=1 Tax=Sugiyamaella lignohabitans TaxID=796027 RepID=A0A167FZR7_9ASCO|nr:Dhr2p [Sugiyamaella lignohabitans]ANB15915.1 Dhr2p [Sugiyamaella lignohabitans]
MGPRKHMKFGDDGDGPVVANKHASSVLPETRTYGRNQSKNKLGNLKSRQSFGKLVKNSRAGLEIEDESSGVESSGPVLGPVSLERLKGYQNGNLSEDSKFHTSSGMDEDEDEDGEESSQELNGKETKILVEGSFTNGNGHANGKSKENGNGNRKDIQNGGQHRKLASKPNGRVVYYDDSEEEDDSRDMSKTPGNYSPAALKSTKLQLLKDRRGLPVYQARTQIIDHLSANEVTVLLAETGSGKSTQIPQLIYEYIGSKESPERIAITQPRRVAAINLATRVSQEMGVPLGEKVGYTVRFQNKSGPATHIKYLTDGMLLRELMLDSDLKRYSTIILDEAHERTVLTDLLMGLLKRLLDKRRGSKRPLKLIVMSATLDAEKFSKFFNNAEILYVEGKMYPVQRYYLSKPIDDIVDGVVQTVVQINMSELTGDILAFLPGQDEIDKSVDRLQAIATSLPKEAPLIVPVPLYASLPPAQQQKAFEKLPARRRKIILATNIAETSLTIPGVRYVVDSGLRKVRVWKPSLGLDTLFTTPISQASAAQRMGRAGREAPGKCYRLFTEATYTQDLRPQTEPEILRCDIASTILMLKRAGIDDVINFDWVESPDKKAITSSLVKLYGLKALNDQGKITALGEKMVVLPVSPHLAAVLIHASSDPTLLNAVIDIVACLSIEDLMINPHPDKRDEINQKRRELFTSSQEHGDLIMIKEMYDMYRELTDRREQKEWCQQVGVNPRSIRNVALVRQQLARYMNLTIDDESYPTSAESIIKCFLHGFISNSALGLPDRRYKTVLTAQPLSIHPSSSMFGRKVEAIMYIEYVFTTKPYARLVSPIQIEWLQEVAPHLLSRRSIGTN